MFHYPTPEVEDRIDQPEQKYWEAGERETLIEARAQEIEHQIKKMLDNWWCDGKTIKVGGFHWDPADLFDSISRESDSVELSKLLRGCKATAEKLIADWAQEMAEKEVEAGILK